MTSPRREPASPIKRIKLKITLEGDGPSVARAREVLKKSRRSGNRLVLTSEASDPAEAMREIARVGEAVRSVENGPKDFK
jgi:hypothetical protein